MKKFGLGLSLAVVFGVSGCGCGGEQPGVTATPARRPAQTSPTDRPTSVVASSDGGSGGGGGSGSGGGGGAAGTAAPDRPPPLRPTQAASPRSRADLDADFEKDTKSLKVQESLNQNPTEARAEAKPKTLEDMAGMNGYDFVNDLYQPSSSIEAIQAGKLLYKPNCARCHGEDGRPDEEASRRLSRYNMADLSQPMRYKYGADGKGIYRSIAFGTQAPPHGTYNGIFTQQQIWNLVAYVESLQKER